MPAQHHHHHAGSAPPGRAPLEKTKTKLVLYTSHVWKNPFEEACAGCAGQRKAPPDLKAEMRQRAMALRNDTTDDLFVDMLGKWEPVKTKGEVLHGSVEFWADNRVKGQLVSTVGVFATVNFESMGEWSAAAGGEITLAWEEFVDDTDYNAMSYDEVSKQISWGGLQFIRSTTFESHLAGSPGKR